jgi:hypothetical protein
MVRTYLTALFVDKKPSIIEYSTAEMNSKLKFSVEAQAVESPLPPHPTETTSGSGSSSSQQRQGQAVDVYAFLRIEDGNSTAAARSIPIVAKPKRVRQLLKEHSRRRLVEDAYGTALKEALRGLPKALEVETGLVQSLESAAKIGN